MNATHKKWGGKEEEKEEEDVVQSNRKVKRERKGRRLNKDTEVKGHRGECEQVR